jgi:hypothetical protein
MHETTMEAPSSGCRGARGVEWTQAIGPWR